MAAPAHIARENGKKGGRPSGRKNDKTLVREAELERLRQRVFAATDSLIDAQFLLAKGIAHVYRVTTGSRGGRSDPELVTNPDELHEAVEAIQAGGGYGDIAEDEGGEEDERIAHRYYFITVKAPDSRAIDSLLDRAYGKAAQALELSGPGGDPLAANLSASDREAITELRDILKQRAA